MTADSDRVDEMFKLYRCLFFFVMFLFVVTSISYASNYAGFTNLNPDDCVPLGEKVVVAKLPAEWHKYAEFTKICRLKEKKTDTAKVSIISVWVEDFTEISGETANWKNFPQPIIVDKNNNKIGALPEVYPRDDKKYPDIHYGKWQSGIPTELKVDVSVNEMNGDYYYEPFKWDTKSRRYLINNLVKHHSKRPDALDPYAYGTVYKGFTQLNPDKCVPLDKKVVFSRLPAEWHKYSDFIKVCELKQLDGVSSDVSIISIWEDIFYDAKLPRNVLQDREHFPLALIVDNNFQVIGRLPEVYPTDDISSLDLYFGKWRLGIPKEIWIDVRNPAVGGDYYYNPLIWDNKNKSYEFKNKEIKQGRRPK